jgi:hypothetical protein
MTLKKVQCTLTLGLALLAANSYAQTVPAGYASTSVTNTLPAKSPAVVADDSIRPFHVSVPEEELVATTPFADCRPCAAENVQGANDVSTSASVSRL